ncbi:phage late control D family protein [Klebsiella pneumoniae]|uniref:phage late control D family protein n=1 Tax=Klebsiella pneumoniae TaxID=573 RepID=UPI0027EB4EF7|nr:phage late control D family protein [Klebsiella pneumoniae]HCA3526905.1 phage late control D family protein [Klebsiella quasipneumoniae]HCM2947350.1 phage late control D family protein [Klebsiella quasipneumoniae subsp. similipneumoniae]HCM3157931.1 phage late control D family protein [Klebsiella quasipneumoniae subsp. similipneumoniae]HCM6337074.1 phage late control D family protein [Klebsiella quasipneumoniae subsp. similipneumoniae]
MVLNTDAIDKVKSLLDTGARDFKAYQDELSRIPALNVLMGGKALTVLDEKLISLELTDNRGFNADELTISVDDSQGDIALPPRGAELSVSLGWQGEPLIYKGIYIVDEVSHSGPPDRIDITARSADFRDEFNVKREVSWHDVTVERIVSAIAHRYKLKPIISEQLMSAEIDHADQTQESDMSFLTRMADILGAIATVKNGCLLFILPGGGVSANGKALPEFAITRSSGDRHSFRIADRDAYTGVQAYWLDLDFGKKKKVTVRKRKKTTEKKPRSSSREGDYIAGEDGNVFVLRTTYSSEIAAQRAAAAKWQQLQRGAAEFNLTLAYGRADLYPEMHGTVIGFKEAIDNQDWIIAKATHSIDDNGFQTRLELEAKIPEWIAESEG